MRREDGVQNTGHNERCGCERVLKEYQVDCLCVLYITGDDENVQISGPVVFEQYVVIADYSKKNKNDISLNAGDIVDVIERNDYGEIFFSFWYR